MSTTRWILFSYRLLFTNYQQG